MVVLMMQCNGALDTKASTRTSSMASMKQPTHPLSLSLKHATSRSFAHVVVPGPQALKGLHSRLREIQAYLELVVAGKLPINHDIMTFLQDIVNLLPNMNVESLTKSLAGAWLAQGTVAHDHCPVTKHGQQLCSRVVSRQKQQSGGSCSGISCCKAVSRSCTCCPSSAYCRYVNHCVYSPSTLLLPPAVKSNDMMLVIYLSSLIRSILALHKLIDNKEQRVWHEKEASAKVEKGKGKDKASKAEAEDKVGL